MTWMNEYEITEAASRYRLHPVLGPATQTLVNLMEWTNSVSDGWVYWRKPSQASGKLQDLIAQGIRHDREAYQSPRTPDVTWDEYRAALRPVKAFRTRQARERFEPGLQRELFGICERPGGELWAAEQDVAAANRLWEDARTRLAATRELLDRATEARNQASWRQTWHDLEHSERSGDPHVMRALALGKPGTRLFVLLGQGQGEVATASGLRHGMNGLTVQYVTDDGENGSRIPATAMTLADARERWWVLDGHRDAIVSGGKHSRAEMENLAYGLTIEDGQLRVAVQGSGFLPLS